MIKSLKRDDISSLPFVVSKKWKASNKENPNLIIADIQPVYGNFFISESYPTSTDYFLSESSADKFVPQTGDSVFLLSSSLAAEYIDYGPGWIIDCDSREIELSGSQVDIESGSNDPIYNESGGPIYIESVNDFSSSHFPYNGPAFRYGLSASVSSSNTDFSLALEQSDDSFLIVEEGIKIDSFQVFNVS